MLRKCKLFLALLALGSSVMVWAEGDVTEVQEMETIVVTAQSEQMESNLLGKRPNVSDQVIEGKTFKQKATTLGDALAGELGIHSNHYGSGASAPIIRGQEGKRIKVLQNNSDILDMSILSPDHAVTVDTTLAKQVELVRGASTLLYSSGNSAGVVNVIDNKLPTAMPEKGAEGELNYRFNTNGNEKLITGGLTLGFGSNVALRLEGLDRRSGNYKTPSYLHYEFESESALKEHLSAPENLASLEREYQHWLANRHLTPYFRYRPKPEQHYIRKESDYTTKKAKYENAIVEPEKLDYLPNSWAKSQSGSIGLSWIGDRGHLGVAYTHRKDNYGLPAHNPMYEGCGAYVVSPASERKKPYLMSYPQLMDEEDTNYINPRADCLQIPSFDSGAGHTHGRAENHEHGIPQIELVSKRYDVRGELNQPFTGVDKVRTSITQTDYHHQEKEGDEVSSSFKNKGTTARLEFSHQPVGNLTGVWGIQYVHSKNNALSPSVSKGRQMLNDNTTKNWSIFGLEQYQWNDVSFELAGRAETQKISMNYDLDKITSVMQPVPNRYNSSVIAKANAERAENLAKALADTQPNKDTAYSYALGVHWKFAPNYTLSFNASHQERLPNAQELYTHGMHLATNSFEVGNKNLTKEKSNNFELGLGYEGDKLDYKVSAYYYDFDNYIYLQTLNESLGNSKVIAPYSLKINRYSQSGAKFHGVEGHIGYQFNPTYHMAVFGDYVKGRLVDLPDAVTAYNSWTGEKTYTPQADRYTPRLPPMRLGTRLQADFDDHFKGEMEYYHVFKQDNVSKFELPTQGHHMVNLGLTYQNQFAKGEYDIFFKANNLLDQEVYAHETFLPYIPQMGRNFSLGVNYKF